MIDASIPLRLNPSTKLMTPGDLLSLKQLAQQTEMGEMQMQGAQEAKAQENALRQIYAQQGNVDPQTGQLSLGAISQVGAVSPKTAAELAKQRAAMNKDLAATRASEAAAANSQLQAMAKKTEMVNEVRGMVLKTYDDALAKGIPPEQAKQVAQSVYSEELGRLGKTGVFGSDEVSKFDSQFDPDRVRTRLSQSKDWLATQVGTWSEPYELDGVKVQKNSKTGEVRQAVSRPQVTNNNTIIKENDKKFEKEDKLRNDYKAEPAVKAASEMQSAFKMIEAAYKNPTPANDLAMATKYMKVLDPTSVVRESEFALAVNATGILDKVRNYADLIVKGQKLNPTQRKDFYDSAKAINDTFQKGREDIDTQYSEMATGYDLNPKNVIPSLRSKKSETPKDEPKPSGAPRVGTVEKGYRFKGGNPADPKSWEKM